MSELYLKKIRSSVDDIYMGYKLPGGRVVPVHVYSGASRIICGYTTDVSNIQKLSYVCNAKGQTPAGRDTSTILKWLQTDLKVDKSVQESEFHTFRLFLQKILDSDKAVFSGTGTGMVSYTSGSDLFITGKSMYEDAGEMIGEIIKKSCPTLSDFIKETLQDRKDSISILFNPVIEKDEDHTCVYTFKQDLPKCFDDLNKYPNAKVFLESIKTSGECLLEHLRLQENKLNVLRQFNLFCMFHLFRFMANVDHLYNNSPYKVFLLDFSASGTTSEARMSCASYMQAHRALANFYKWGCAQILKKEGWTRKDLLKEDTPAIDKGKPNKNHEELEILWKIVKEKCHSLDEESSMKEFGATLFDMLERDGKESSTTYFKLFGIHAGILIQGRRSLPPRFKPKADMLEMIIRCCVKPGITIRGVKLKDNLWERLGIIIGGDEKDIDRLNESRCVVTSDDDSLITNYENFAEKLRSMNFAETMADGILQINLGGEGNE